MPHIWPRLFTTHSWNTQEALTIPEGPTAEMRVCLRWRKEMPLPSLPLRCNAFWMTSLPTHTEIFFQNRLRTPTLSSVEIPVCISVAFTSLECGFKSLQLKCSNKQWGCLSSLKLQYFREMRKHFRERREPSHQLHLSMGYMKKDLFFISKDDIHRMRGF